MSPEECYGPLYARWRDAVTKGGSMIAECDGCHQEAELRPPAYIWIQEMEGKSYMLVRASLCRSCLLAMLQVVRPDLRPRIVPNAFTEPL